MIIIILLLFLLATIFIVLFKTKGISVCLASLPSSFCLYFFPFWRPSLPYSNSMHRHHCPSLLVSIVGCSLWLGCVHRDRWQVGMYPKVDWALSGPRLLLEFLEKRNSFKYKSFSNLGLIKPACYPEKRTYLTTKSLRRKAEPRDGEGATTPSRHYILKPVVPKGSILLCQKFLCVLIKPVWGGLFVATETGTDITYIFFNYYKKVPVLNHHFQGCVLVK